jgi:ABC-2 type transport system permease protein
VNWQQLQAFMWLRYRLTANHWRRGGALNAAFNTIFAMGAIALAIPLFFGCFALGLLAFSEAAPADMMYIWDAVVVAFLFFWAMGLVVELQRTDPLSLSKFLHLPVSVSGAFAINYVSSLFCLCLIVFAPIMFGLGLGLIFARGISLLPVLPLAAAFLLMITALTYQFQGWLASLMSNPRRRRSIIVAAMAVFVLIVQLPSMVNIIRPWEAGRGADPSAALTDEFEELNRALAAGEIDAPQHERRTQEALDRHQAAVNESNHETAAYVARIAKIVNLALPIGWLPMGVMSAAAGHVALTALPLLGMSLIGAASLWRAYRTTVRLYQGQHTMRKSAPAPAAASPAKVPAPIARPLERRLPGVSEPVSAIALAGFRSLIRAPETKMLLLTPLILGAIFGSMIFKMPGNFPDAARPLAAIGAMVFALFTVVQLMGNQFAFDRDGFRVFVLCATPRRDILLGKNLAFVPLAAAMAALMVTIVEVACPMRLEHLLAMLPQFVSMFLSFCILANVLSILAPMPIAAGSLKPAKPKITMILLQIVLFTFLFPLTQAPTVLPLAIEALVEWLGWTAGAPVCLLLTVAECAAFVFIYRLALNLQGDLLQAREQQILEIVTSRAA